VGIATETLHAKKREIKGTRACRRLREEGQVPAVLYGHKEKTVPIQVSVEELETAVRRRSRMFELHLGKKRDVVLLKELQYDSFGDAVVHADFVRIAMDEKLTLEVTILLKGAPKVEHTVLQQPLANVEVECLPKDIPEAIVAQVGDMVEGESRKVGVLQAPPGVKILTDPEVIFVTLTTIVEEVVAAAPAPEEVAAVEPEVIGRKVEAEEGEEEAAEPEEKPKTKEKKE
jgi:large subunit ribosomal protein L25